MLRHRENKGVSALLILALIPVSIILGIVAVDVAHYSQVKNALSQACDSGALSGAVEVQAATTPTGLARVESVSRMVAALNLADGDAVETNATTRTIVSVNITPPDFPNGELGKVRVSATKTVDNVLGGFIGRPRETVTATALAGPTKIITDMAVGQWFPIAVSWNRLNGAGQTLKNMSLNQSFDIQVKDNTNRNAWYAGKSTKAINKQIDQYLKLGSYSDGHIDPNDSPPLKRGDQVTLKNGVPGQIRMAQPDAQAAVLNTIMYLPVVDIPAIPTGKSGSKASGNLGSSAGSGKQGPRVIGFIGFKVNSLDTTSPNFTFKGTLVKGVRYGKSDTGNTPLLPGTEQAMLDSLSVTSIKLLE